MGVFKNFIGTMKGIFHIGGPSGNLLKNEIDGLSVRNSGDTIYQNLGIAQAAGNNVTHATNWQDLRDTNALIQFNFDGASAPSPGANLNSYGFCHTSGGSYTAGVVYYDNGTELVAIKIPVGTNITTGTAISGTVSLNANALYVAHSASAPHSWTLKGDGGPTGVGYFQVIEIPIDTSATKSSTTAIPAGARVHSVSTHITSPYDNGAAIDVIVDGTSDLTIQPVDENDPSIENSYVSFVEDGAVDANTEGVVTVNISNAPSTGSGVVAVNFVGSASS